MRERRMFIADARFLCWDRLPCMLTTLPVGIWVMRIADSVLLTCWPPAPCKRMASIHKSSLLMPTSTSSTSGATPTVAAAVGVVLGGRADEDLLGELVAARGQSFALGFRHAAHLGFGCGIGDQRIDAGKLGIGGAIGFH